MRWRTLLYTPGDRPERYTKAWSAGLADVVCADLEDAVAPGGRPAARQAVARALAAVPAKAGTLRAVRINPWPGAAEDLESVVPARPDAIVVPKVESRSDVEALLKRLRELSGDAPVPQLVAILETARGVVRAREILEEGGLAAVCFGAEDLAANAGLRRSTANTEVQTARQWVALCAAAAGVPALDMITAAYQDTERCAREAAEARAWGYAGKMCIHPAQVEAVNQAFAPSEDELAWAREVLEASARGRLESGGIAVVRGQMVDVPVIRRAQRIVADAAH